MRWIPIALCMAGALLPPNGADPTPHVSLLTFTHIIVYNVNTTVFESENTAMNSTATNTPTTTNINIRIDANVKQEAETLFEKLGMSISGAINIFFRQAIRQQAIPFEIKAKSPEGEYNDYFTPDVVKSILESAEQFKRGEYISFSLDELIAMEDGEIPQRAIDFLESRKKAGNQ